jgi:hypothetical protein
MAMLPWAVNPLVGWIVCAVAKTVGLKVMLPAPALAAASSASRRVQEPSGLAVQPVALGAGESSAVVLTTQPGIGAKFATMLSRPFMVMVVVALDSEFMSALPVQPVK